MKYGRWALKATAPDKACRVRMLVRCHDESNAWRYSSCGWNRTVSSGVRLGPATTTHGALDSRLNWTPTIPTRIVTTRYVASSSSFQNQEQQDGRVDCYDKIKLDLLEGTLEQVAPYGWTRDAIAQAALSRSHNNKDGSSIALAGLVTPGDVVAHVLTGWNERLQADLAAQRVAWDNEGEPTTTNGLRGRVDVTERLAWGFQRRLEYSLVYVQMQRWQEGMVVGAYPNNVTTTLSQLQSMIDILAAGIQVPSDHDQMLSLPEKVGLLPVFVLAELHLLSDTSENYQDTWDFLRQRLDGWDRLRSSSSRTMNPTAMMDFLSSSIQSLSTLSSSSSISASAAATAILSALSLQQKRQQQDVSSSSSSIGATSALTLAHDALYVASTLATSFGYGAASLLHDLPSTPSSSGSSLSSSSTSTTTTTTRTTMDTPPANN